MMIHSFVAVSFIAVITFLRNIKCSVTRCRATYALIEQEQLLMRRKVAQTHNLCL
jgi:hypothetical protein